MQMPGRFQPPPICLKIQVRLTRDIGGQDDQRSSGPENSMALMHQTHRIVNMLNDVTDVNRIKVVFCIVLIFQVPETNRNSPGTSNFQRDRIDLRAFTLPAQRFHASQKIPTSTTHVEHFASRLG